MNGNSTCRLSCLHGIMKLLLLLLPVLMLTGCSSAGTKGGSAGAVPAPEQREQEGVQKEAEAPINIVDMFGRSVTLEKPAKRIVALGASDCEILYAIGAGNRLVGCGQYCDYPAEVTQLPVLNTDYQINAEQIAALNPDVVILSDMMQTEESAELLSRLNIPSIFTDAQNIEGVYEAIALLGRVTGCETKAASLIDSMKAQFAGVTAVAEASETEGGTVYFEISPLEYGLWTACAGSFMDEIAGIAGIRNIFADVKGSGGGWAEVSQEQVIRRNPDLIISTTMYLSDGTDPAGEIASRPGWQGITAVQNHRIFVLDSDMLTRPGPRLADAAVCICEIVYGKRPD